VRTSLADRLYAPSVPHEPTLFHTIRHISAQYFANKSYIYWKRFSSAWQVVVKCQCALREGVRHAPARTALTFIMPIPRSQFLYRRLGFSFRQIHIQDFVRTNSLSPFPLNSCATPTSLAICWRSQEGDGLPPRNRRFSSSVWLRPLHPFLPNHFIHFPLQGVRRCIKNNNCHDHLPQNLLDRRP